MAKKPNHPKHIGLHALFQIGGQGGYSLVAINITPNIPFTGIPEIDRIIVGVPLVVAATFIAKKKRWF